LSTVDPDLDQFLAVVADLPPEKPIVMLNLLRFRDVAEYDGQPADCSGRVAYLERYGPPSLEHVARVGGELVYAGDAAAALIGPADERWDMVLLVRYPSIGAFVTMASDPAYLEIAVHRTAALADSRLVPTLEG